MGRLFALVAVIFFAPFHLAIAALIFFLDGGPVFYRPKRLGKDGRPFTMFKYRSMRVGTCVRCDSSPILMGCSRPLDLHTDVKV